MIVTTICEDRPTRSFVVTAVDFANRRQVYRCQLPISSMLTVGQLSELDLYSMMIRCLLVNDRQLIVDLKMLLELVLEASSAATQTTRQCEIQRKNPVETKANPTIELLSVNVLPKLRDVAKILAMNVVSTYNNHVVPEVNSKIPKKAAEHETSELSLSQSLDSLDILIEKKNDHKRLDVFALKIQSQIRGLLMRKKYKKLRMNESIVMYKRAFWQDHLSISCTILKKLANQEYTIYGFNFDMKYYFKPESFYLAEGKHLSPDDQYFSQVFSKTYFDLDSKTIYYKDFLTEETASLLDSKFEGSRELEKRQAEQVMKKTVMKFLNIIVDKKIFFPVFDQRFKVIGKKTIKLEGENLAIMVVYGLE